MALSRSSSSRPVSRRLQPLCRRAPEGPISISGMVSRSGFCFVVLFVFFFLSC